MSLKPQVSIIMGSTSDLPVMEKAAARLDALGVPFEILALSAHRTPREVEAFASSAHERGIKVTIGAAAMPAHLCEDIPSMTSVPVIGVPIKASLEGVDALYSIVQMPPGIPVATVGINAAENAALRAVQMTATGYPELYQRLEEYKASLKDKVVKANAELAELKYRYKTN